MILVRNVFRAKFGRANELVAIFKQNPEAWGTLAGRERVLTDLSGPFYTVVVEAEVASLAEWEELRAEMFSNPQFGEVFGRAASLIESGYSEYYTIET